MSLSGGRSGPTLCLERRGVEGCIRKHDAVMTKPAAVVPFSLFIIFLLKVLGANSFSLVSMNGAVT